MYNQLTCAVTQIGKVFSCCSFSSFPHDSREKVSRLSRLEKVANANTVMIETDLKFSEFLRLRLNLKFATAPFKSLSLLIVQNP